MAEIIVSQFFGPEEKNQVACSSPEEARQVIEEGNAGAAQRWHWGLSRSNFYHDNGDNYTLEEANALRRACGLAEF